MMSGFKEAMGWRQLCEPPGAQLLAAGRDPDIRPISSLVDWARVAGALYPGERNPPLEIASLVHAFTAMTGRFANLLKQGSRLLCVTDPTAMLPVAYRLDNDEQAFAPRTLGSSAPVL